MTEKIWKPSTDNNVLNDNDREETGEWSLKVCDMQSKAMKGITAKVGQSITIKGLQNKKFKAKIIGFNKGTGQVGRIIFYETKPGFFGFIDPCTCGEDIICVK